MSQWKFLSKKERAWVVRRVNADRGDVEAPKFQLSQYLGAGLDWRLWYVCYLGHMRMVLTLMDFRAYGLIFFGSTTMTYALAFFIPIILNEQVSNSLSLFFDTLVSHARNSNN